MIPLLQRFEQLRARYALWRCAEVGDSPRVYGRVWVHGGGRVVVGNRVVLDGSRIPIELRAEPGGEIRIGDDVRIDGGASIECSHSISIGNRCQIGPYAKLLDNHFHTLTDRDKHMRPRSEQVVLEEDVRLGERSIVLPGAHLQKGVTLEPRTVISRRVPPGVALAGNPAKAMKKGSAG
jgi:acetyltransferase-like isoleucine patch superfamily enzyme